MTDVAPATLGEIRGAGLLRKPGRKTRCTDEVIEACAKDVAAGAYVEVVAARQGIHRQSWYNWKSIGEALDTQVQAIEDNGELTEDDKAQLLAELEWRSTHHQLQCLKFFRAIEVAEANGEMAAVATWAMAARNDWRAAKEFLARRHPARWSERQALELSGPGGGPIVSEDRSLGAVARRIANDPELRESADAFLAQLAGSTPGRIGDDDEDDAPVAPDGAEPLEPESPQEATEADPAAG